eukprot:30927-Pelagococcus_subviridis.AAC.5
MSKFFAAKNLAMSASTCAFPVIGSSVIGSRVCAFATGAGVAADVFAAGVGAAAPAAASAASAASASAADNGRYRATGPALPGGRTTVCPKILAAPGVRIVSSGPPSPFCCPSAMTSHFSKSVVRRLRDWSNASCRRSISFFTSRSSSNAVLYSHLLSSIVAFARSSAWSTASHSGSKSASDSVFSARATRRFSILLFCALISSLAALTRSPSVFAFAYNSRSVDLSRSTPAFCAYARLKCSNARSRSASTSAGGSADAASFSFPFSFSPTMARSVDDGFDASTRGTAAVALYPPRVPPSPRCSIPTRTLISASRCLTRSRISRSSSRKSSNAPGGSTTGDGGDRGDVDASPPPAATPATPPPPPPRFDLHHRRADVRGQSLALVRAAAVDVGLHPRAQPFDFGFRQRSAVVVDAGQELDFISQLLVLALQAFDD